MFLIARADVDPASIVESIRRALREIDPELPLANVRLLETVAGAAIATAPVSADGLVDMRPEAAIVLPARSGS